MHPAVATGRESFLPQPEILPQEGRGGAVRGIARQPMESAEQVAFAAEIRGQARKDPPPQVAEAAVG